MSSIVLNNEPLAKSRSGKWEIRFTEKLPDGRFRSRTVSTRETSKSAAQAFLKEWLDAEKTATKRAARQDVDAILDRYLKARTGETEHWVCNQLRPFFGPLLPQEIDDGVIADYRAGKPHLADGTVRRHLATLIAALNFSVKNKHIHRDDVPHIELPPQSPGRELFLDEQQESEFHAYAMGDSIGQKRLTRVTRFVAIALDTASRKTAIETLTWDRVDLRRRLIDFRLPGVVVTNKRRVAVPIATRLLPVLQRAHEEAISEYVIDPGSIRSAYETFREKTPYPWVTPHVLRHTWATLAARDGVDMWRIAGVLGDDEATVRKHYLHHSPGHLLDAVDRRNF